MRKAILTKFIHLLFLALVLNTFIALVVTSSVLLKRSREDMHFALESVDRMLDYTGNVEEQLMDLSDLTNDNNSRYTLIRMDGTVVADTEVAQVNQMENHLEQGSEGCAGDGLWIFGAAFRNVRNADGVRGDPFIGRQIHTAPFCLFNRFG